MQRGDRGSRLWLELIGWWLAAVVFSVAFVGLLDGGVGAVGFFASTRHHCRRVKSFVDRVGGSAAEGDAKPNAAADDDGQRTDEVTGPSRALIQKADMLMRFDSILARRTLHSTSGCCSLASLRNTARTVHS